MKSQTVKAAKDIKPKAGFFEISKTEKAWPVNQGTIIKVVGNLWESIFMDESGFSFDAINGYVEPTTEELQALYDSTTGVDGDPTKINSFLFRCKVFDLINKTAADPRWIPYLDLRVSYGPGEMNDKIYQMFRDAEKGEVENVYLTHCLQNGNIKPEELEE